MASASPASAPPDRSSASTIHAVPGSSSGASRAAPCRLPGGGASSPPQPSDAALRRADALALSLAAGLHRVTPALARVAAAAVGKMIWFDFGFARLDDHARLGRAGLAAWYRNDRKIRARR